MDLIMDGLLIAAAIFAGTYCAVLAGRVRALKDLDSGVGGAIMQMTRALEDARRTLEEAKAANRDGNRELRDLVVRAEAASGQLRILLAATRDLPPAPERQAPDRQAPEPRPRRASAGGARAPGTEDASPAPVARPALEAPLPALEPGPWRPLGAAARSVPPRVRPDAPPASEDDLLAALADFAAART